MKSNEEKYARRNENANEMESEQEAIAYLNSIATHSAHSTKSYQFTFFAFSVRSLCDAEMAGDKIQCECVFVI